MTTFLATLSAAAISNWDICVEHGLWGTGTSNHAKAAARAVQAGDLIAVWGSKRGLLALAKADGVARPVRSPRNVPWPDPERYSYTFSISVVHQLALPVGDAFVGTTSKRFGIKAHYMQAGFYALPEDAAARVLEAFPSTDAVTPPRETSTGDAGRRPGVAGIYLQRSAPIAESLLSLYRRSKDPHEELLLIGSEGDRATVAAELAQEPFASMSTPIRFLTADELAEELRSKLGSRPGST